MELFVDYIQWVVPTWLLRFLIRCYLRISGPMQRCGDVVVRQIELDRHGRGRLPVTSHTEEANEQHYGNDPAFFEAHLGPCLKYSACEWPSTGATLAEAELYTLRKYQRLACLDGLVAGSRVLELGCGWGSLSIANARQYPELEFTAFSNSPQQIGHIQAQAEFYNLRNLHVHVEDYAVFCTADSLIPHEQTFDAAIAIETVEHARDIRTLLEHVAQRLKPQSKLFVHSLLHQSNSYLLDDSDWMGRNFFTGGSILALNSYHHIAPPSLYISEVHPVNGQGYSRTLLAWLEALERNRTLMVNKYGRSFYEGFRMFYIMCAEAFAANNGNEFMCGYYVFEKR